MNKELILFAKTLLRERYEKLEVLLAEFEKSDRKTFVHRHRKLFEKAVFDTEEYDDIDEETLFLCFAIQTKFMYYADWSGEEYPGQVKRSITNMLNNYKERALKWDSKKFEATLDFSTLKRGEYLPLLFSAMDERLQILGYRIAIFDNMSDTYYYCLLSNLDMQLVNGLQTGRFSILDTKIYAVYLIDKGSEGGKILLYLKNKFSLPLNEIKTFASQPEIMFIKGNLITVTKEKTEVEKIGGKVRIEEIVQKGH